MITVTVEMKRLLKKMNALTEALSPEAIAEHHVRTTTGYLKNRVLRRFESEGDEVSGQWPQLAHVTQMDRLVKGFPPAHPILRRTGALRKWVMDSEPGTTGERFFWPSRTPPNNTHIMFAYGAAQMGARRTPRRRIVVVNMRDFMTIKELLASRIAVALNA